MPAAKYKMVRVKVETLERLQREAARIVAAVENGTRDDPGINPEQINPACNGLSLDALINLLLDKPAATLRRRREQREREKAARQAGQAGRPGDDQGDDQGDGQ